MFVLTFFVPATPAWEGGREGGRKGGRRRGEIGEGGEEGKEGEWRE